MMMILMEITHWLWSFELKLLTKCQKVLSYSQPRKAIPESVTSILKKVKHNFDSFANFGLKCPIVQLSRQQMLHITSVDKRIKVQNKH